MGRLFLVDFDPAEGNVYECCHCDTPIVLELNESEYDLVTDQLSGRIFLDVQNVYTTPAQDRIINNHMVTEIYCVKCGSHLGFKLMQVAPDEVILNNRDYLMKMDKIKLKIVEEADD